MFNRIVLDDNRRFIAVVLQMAEDKVAGAHGVNISRYKGRRKFIIIWELFIVITHNEKCLDGVDIVIRLDFIFQRGERLIQRVCRYITDAATENIADTQYDDQLQVILRNDALGIIIMYFK